MMRNGYVACLVGCFISLSSWAQIRIDHDTIDHPVYMDSIVRTKVLIHYTGNQSMTLAYKVIYEDYYQHSNGDLLFLDCDQSYTRLHDSSICFTPLDTAYPSSLFAFYSQGVTQMDQTAYVSLLLYDYNDSLISDSLTIRFNPTFYSSTEEVYSSPFSKLSIYPNPSDGMIHVRLGEDVVEELNVRVLNALGEQVALFAYESSIGNSAIPLDLSHLPHGLYTLHLNTDSQQSAQKILLR